MKKASVVLLFLAVLVAVVALAQPGGARRFINYPIWYESKQVFLQGIHVDGGVSVVGGVTLTGDLTITTALVKGTVATVDAGSGTSTGTQVVAHGKQCVCSSTTATVGMRCSTSFDCTEIDAGTYPDGGSMGLTDGGCTTTLTAKSASDQTATYLCL